MISPSRLRKMLSRRAAEEPERPRLRRSSHPPAEDLVDEALAIAGAALRLAAKNRLIIRAFRDGARYDEDEVLDAIRAELHALADEKDADASRVARAQASARKRRGSPAHEHDYRAADVASLALREQVSAGLARRLRELAGDDGYVRSIADAAREAALDDVATTMQARFAPLDAESDRHYEFERDQRMDDVRADLERLRRRRVN